MLAITGWVSLMLLCGGPATGEPEGLVRVQVRELEMKGIGWRGATYHDLTPQERQGAATVWTAGPAGFKHVLEQADQIVQLPRSVAAEGASTRFRNEIQHNFVANLKRIADGPQGKNTKVAYEPQIDSVSDGVTAEYSCRTVKGGTMVRASLDNSRLIGFETFSFRDSVTDPKTKNEWPVFNPQVQVPELNTCHVAGEWFVPEGGVLIVGFGPKSAIPHDKASEVRERVMIIEPSSVKPEVVAGQVMIGAQAIPIAGFEPKPLKARDASVRTARFSRPKAIAVPLVPRVKPIAIPPTVLPLLASPTLVPRVGWKATVRIDARMTPPTVTDEDVVSVMCLPLSAAPLPIKLSNVWLSASIEPRRAEAAAMRMATPPSRDLPTAIAFDGAVVELPPLPDSAVDLASTSEATATPQALPVAGAPRPLRPLDDRLRVVLDQFMADRYDALNQLVCDEVVIFPAPASSRLLAASSLAPGCSQNAAWQRALAQPIQPIVDGAISQVRQATSPVEAKIDADFLRTYYGAMFRTTNDSEREIERHPISIELPAAPRKAVQGATLGLQLKTANGECEYDSGISLKSIESQPVTVRVPMADGTIVEIQAKVVKPAKK